MTRAPILEGTRVNGPIRSPRFALKLCSADFPRAASSPRSSSRPVAWASLVKDRARLAVLRSLWDYPELGKLWRFMRRSKHSKTVTLTNTGSGILMITGISVAGTGFTASGPHLPIALSAGQSTTISVVFKPAAALPTLARLRSQATRSNPPWMCRSAGPGQLSQC